MLKEQCRIQLFEEMLTELNYDLQNFIYSLTRKDLYAMEDIFQNTMVQALQGLNGLRDVEKMKSWLFSIAKAEARRYYAKNQTRINIEYNDFPAYDNIYENEKELDDFTKAVADKELVKIILNQLSDEEQRIYILYYIYDVPLKEISKILHMKYNTVKSIHVRGFKKIKKLCKERQISNE